MHRGLLILRTRTLHIDSDSAKSLDGYGKIKVVDLWQWFEVDMRDIHRLNTLYCKVLLASFLSHFSALNITLFHCKVCFCYTKIAQITHMQNCIRGGMCVCVFACVIFSCEFPSRLAGNHSFSLPLNNTHTHTNRTKRTVHVCGFSIACTYLQCAAHK